MYCKNLFDEWYRQLCLEFCKENRDRLHHKSIGVCLSVYMYLCVFSDLFVLNNNTCPSLIAGRVAYFDKGVTIATFPLCFIDRVTVLKCFWMKCGQWTFWISLDASYEPNQGSGKELWSRNQGHGSERSSISGTCFPRRTGPCLQSVYYSLYIIRCCGYYQRSLKNFMSSLHRIHREINWMALSKPQTQRQKMKQSNSI